MNRVCGALNAGFEAGKAVPEETVDEIGAN